MYEDILIWFWSFLILNCQNIFLWINTFIAYLHIYNWIENVLLLLVTKYLSYLNPKGEDSSCKIEIYGFLYIKIKMSVACLIFEPHPPTFENQHNFWRCSNDAKIIFWLLYWFQIFKDQCGVFRPYL